MCVFGGGGWGGHTLEGLEVAAYYTLNTIYMMYGCACTHLTARANKAAHILHNSKNLHFHFTTEVNLLSDS